MHSNEYTAQGEQSMLAESRNTPVAPYSDKRLKNKIMKYAVHAGRILIEAVLTLYYALNDPDTPAWARAVILGALGYFISPLDLCPDYIPAIGFSDDLIVVLHAMAILAAHVKQVHRARAREWVERILGRGAQEGPDSARVIRP